MSRTHSHRFGRDFLRSLSGAMPLCLLLSALPILSPAFAQGKNPAPPAPITQQNTPTKLYSNEDLRGELPRFEEKFRKLSSAYQSTQNALPLGEIKKQAETALSKKDFPLAMKLASLAIGFEPSFEHYRLYWRAALNSEPANDVEKNALNRDVGLATYAAYQRAKTTQEQGLALASLGVSFERREIWRPMLEAYKVSLAAQENPNLRKNYEIFLDKYGFRVTEDKIDSNALVPRACYIFSETLATGKFDFTPFVTVNGPKSDSAVSAEDRQICIDGLKHGERYKITLRAGIPAENGDVIRKNLDYEFYIRDRAPSVRFTGKNYVLPRIGQQGLPIVSINSNKASVEIFRIGERNLLSVMRAENFLAQLNAETARQFSDDLGEKIWSGSIDTVVELNREVTTAFPVQEALKDLKSGVYVMMAQSAQKANADEYSERATQWFVVSDLGLTSFSGQDGLYVLVNSLASAKPIAGTEIRLIARNNEVLGRATSDDRGLVRFDAGLAKGTGGLAPNLITASDGKGDFGFLDQGQTAFDLSDRGVKGRSSANAALDAFVYTERGVYRSGETVYATTLLRNQAGIAVSNLPLTIVVKRPDGVEYRRNVLADQGLGGRVLSLPLLSSAQSGTWHIGVYADPKGNEIGGVDFLVEDYIPEKLDVKLTPKSPSIRAKKGAEITLNAQWLYGAPGADLEVSGEVILRAADTPKIPNFEGFSFGLSEESFESVTQEIEQKGTTDAKGIANLTIPLPDSDTLRPLEASITLRVGEAGGRAISRQITLPVMPEGKIIGVKKRFNEGEISLGSNAKFELIALNEQGARMALPKVSWTLYQIDRSYQWYQSEGRWTYEAARTSRKINNGDAEIKADGTTEISLPITEWGNYRLDVKAIGTAATPSSVSFQTGYATSAKADSPDTLELRLDKSAYLTGESMEIKLAPRFAGEVTLAVLNESLRHIENISVPLGGKTVSLPVKAEWGASAYIVALAHRPLDVAAKRMPGRALGLSWFSIDKPAHQAKLSLDLPKTMRAAKTLEIPVKVAGLKAGDEAYMTLAAVDVGILNLTHFESPKPSEYYFGQRLLGTDLRDLYGALIDGMQGTRGLIRSGGDKALGMNKGAIPPTEAPLARFSGVVKIAADGSTKIPFDLPNFNGTIRVMGVVWSKDKLGEVEHDLIIREPVVISATLPRFLNTGDASRMSFDIHNIDGPAGNYTLELTAEGPLALSTDQRKKTLNLAKGARQIVQIPVMAEKMGAGGIQLRLTSQAASSPIELTRSYHLAVQPAAQPLINRNTRQLAAGQSISLSKDLVDGFLPGSSSLSVSVAPLSALDVPGLLKALDRYPYGCTEQTVSRALPLLYANQLASMEKLNLDPDLNGRVNTAIERVLARQSSNGTFGLWSIGGNDLWLDAYVADFLTRAREKNFTLPPRALDTTLDRLRNAIANSPEIDQNTPKGYAYALYVLARNGRPVMGDLRYISDSKLDKLSNPLAKAQIAAALALLGDRARAERAFKSALQSLEREKDTGLSRPDYGSRLRDGAKMLALMSETNSDAADIPRVIKIVEDARQSTRYTSTQEQAAMVLAASARSKTGEELSLTIDHQPHKGAFFTSMSGDSLQTAPLTISNSSSNPVTLQLSVAGVPKQPEPPVDQGYGITRSYFSLKGEKLAPMKIRQNDRIVVVLEVTEKEAQYGKLLLVDPLPAGLEIENPALVDGTSLEGLPFLKREIEPVSTEYRDDRFVAAFEREKGQSALFSVAYIVRAVSLGRYTLPAAMIEDMYRPDRMGRTAIGSMEVSAR